jgi:hypothetical protein
MATRKDFGQQGKRFAWSRFHQRPTCRAKISKIVDSPVVDANTLNKIIAAIGDKHSVWISYQDNLPREIVPSGFKEGKEGRLVNAICSIIDCVTNKRQDQQRSFYLHKITRIEYYNWDNAPTPTEDQGVYFSIFILLVFTYLLINYQANLLKETTRLPISTQNTKGIFLF